MAPETMATRWALWRRALLVGAILSPIGAVDHGLSGFLYVTVGATVVAAIVLDAEAWARRRFRPAGAPPIPVLGFIAWGVMVTVVAILKLISGPVDHGELLLAAYAVCWWGVAILLVRGVLSAVALALALMALPWGYVVLLLTGWAVIAVRDYGVQRVLAAGNLGMYLTLGALMGFGVFVPLTLIAVGLVRAFVREWRRRRDLTVSVLPRSAR